MQYPYSLGEHETRYQRHTRHIAARTAEARHKAHPDRVVTKGEDNRDYIGRCFSRRGGRRALRHNHRYLLLHKASRKRGKPIVVTLRPTILDPNVVILDEAAFRQSFEKCRCEMDKFLLCPAV